MFEFNRCIFVRTEFVFQKEFFFFYYVVRSEPGNRSFLNKYNSDGFPVDFRTADQLTRYFYNTTADARARDAPDERPGRARGGESAQI